MLRPASVRERVIQWNDSDVPMASRKCPMSIQESMGIDDVDGEGEGKGSVTIEVEVRPRHKIIGKCDLESLVGQARRGVEDNDTPCRLLIT